MLTERVDACRHGLLCFDFDVLRMTPAFPNILRLEMCSSLTEARCYNNHEISKREFRSCLSRRTSGDRLIQESNSVRVEVRYLRYTV